MKRWYWYNRRSFGLDVFFSWSIGLGFNLELKTDYPQGLAFSLWLPFVRFNVETWWVCFDHLFHLDCPLPGCNCAGATGKHFETVHKLDPAPAVKYLRELRMNPSREESGKAKV